MNIEIASWIASWFAMATITARITYVYILDKSERSFQGWTWVLFSLVFWPLMLPPVAAYLLATSGYRPK